MSELEEFLLLKAINRNTGHKQSVTTLQMFMNGSLEKKVKQTPAYASKNSYPVELENIFYLNNKPVLRTSLFIVNPRKGMFEFSYKIMDWT
jgi:hypothetical protein